MFSVSKSKVMTQICTCEVKREVLFWSFKSCPLCWDVLFFTSVTCAGTKKITHTRQYWHLSLYSCCSVLPRSDQGNPPETRFILIPQQPPMQGFVRNEEENMNTFSSLMFRFNYHERDRTWTWLNVGWRAKCIKFYENFLHSYGWRVMAGTVKTICWVFW